jgi:hypothetical protein
MTETPYQVNPDAISEEKITLIFSSVDTEELKNTEINFDGNLGFFKVGDGACNHF